MIEVPMALLETLIQRSPATFIIICRVLIIVMVVGSIILGIAKAMGANIDDDFDK